MNFTTKKAILILAIVLLISSLFIGGLLIYKYLSAKLLCDKIKLGENIDTNISKSLANGLTAPKWFKKISRVMQIGGPRIPLVEACYYRNIQAVETLLANGADPNFYFPGDFTPLEAAIVYGPVNEDSFEIIKLLLQHGAQVDTWASGSPIIIKLSTFIALGNDIPYVQEILLLLLEHGANCYWEGYNRVMFDIVKSGNVDLASVFFKNNQVDINELNTTGQNLLMVSIDNNYECSIDMINLLLQHGINKHTVDMNGYTAYDYAKRNGLEEIAGLLS